MRKFLQFLIIGFMIVLYIVLTAICIGYFFYVEDITMVVFWLVSLLLNIGIIVFVVKNRLKLSHIICIIVFINFVLLALYVFFNGNLNYLKGRTTIEKILDYLFSVVLVSITGNWMLPLLYYFGFCRIP